MSRSMRNGKKSKRATSAVYRFLAFFSSIRFGIYLLIAIGILSLIGMLVLQQNVTGFATFFAKLGPAERGFLAWLGLFDVYHSWYYRLLLGALALNIILSSIDRLPATWKLVRNPNVTLAPTRFEAQKHFKDYFLFTGDVEGAAETAERHLKEYGFRDVRTASAGSARFVFGQKGSWNTFGAYAVHLSLLLILLGGLLTSWLAVSGEMALKPGMSSRQITTTEVTAASTKRVTTTLPFEIYCRDMRQKLINAKGSIKPSNTLDWINDITIIDGNTRTDATVSLNSPVDYKGYRILHSSFVPVGKARTVTISAIPEKGEPETVTIKRGGSTRLKDGTVVRFADFRAGFDMTGDNPTADTTDYDSPAAFLEITAPDGTKHTAFAFSGSMADMEIAKNPVAGYIFRIKDFERVADSHILLVRKDPGEPLLYTGFGLLVVSLLGVFLFSHKRIWFRADSEAEGIRVRIAGDTNRPYDTFPKQFEAFAGELYEDLYEDEE